METKHLTDLIQTVIIYNYANQNKHVKKYNRKALSITNKIRVNNLTLLQNTNV